MRYAGMARLVPLCAAMAGSLVSQTTSGVVRGLIRDSVTGQALSAATFLCENADTNTAVTASSDARGMFSLSLLPPGRYRIHAGAKDHQDAEIENLYLPVAGILEFDLRLWAARFGFSYALDQRAKTVLRGGSGTFYDRSFDNLWENLALNKSTTCICS